MAKQQQRQKEAEARKPGLDALHSITLRSFKKVSGLPGDLVHAPFIIKPATPLTDGQAVRQ